MKSLLVALALVAAAGSTARADEPEGADDSPPAAAVAPTPRPLEIDWRIDAPLLAGVALMDWQTLVYQKEHTVGACPCTAHDVLPFDRWALGRHDHTGAEASNVLEYTFIVVPPAVALFGDPGPLREALITTAVVVEAQIASESITGFLKAVVHRPRPYAITGQSVPSDVYTSFPSGHTSAAFVGASALVAVRAFRRPGSPANRWIAAAAFAGAATTGFLRVEAGRHYPTDVVGGAAIGALCGFGIPAMHAHGLELLPSPGGLAVGGRF